MDFPIVDLSTVAPSDPGVGSALATSGFVILAGHGLDAGHWQRAYQAAERAFALPVEVKETYRGPQDGSQRGYLPLRKELPDGRPSLDRKEAWHARPAMHRHANLFPREVPELSSAALGLLAALDDLAARVLASIGTFLGLSPRTFESMIEGSDSLLRFNHYPDLAAGEPRVRFRAHRDFDLVTLLLGADQPGLEVRSRDGRWWPLSPSADAIVLNAGDILALESGGRIPSATGAAPASSSTIACVTPAISGEGAPRAHRRHPLPRRPSPRPLDRLGRRRRRDHRRPERKPARLP